MEFMKAHQIEELSMHEKEFESRITRLEITNEIILSALKELKEGQKELKNEIRILKSETWTQTKWVMAFIFVILGSPYFAALSIKISHWIH
jgi:hypothetical protein